ncbi:MAG: hypothetical protein NTZ16_05980 [Verrucomicrobia bacterium]|nr:hypothetical protein [Verrucomicrobiota bacterium]
MKLPSKCKWRVAVAVFGIIGLTSCTTEVRHRVLCVFFEGVDETNAVPAMFTENISPTNAGGQTVATSSSRLSAAPVIHYHKPYDERKCTACHVSRQSQQLRAEGGDLCLECHKKLIGDAKYVHPPVDDGKCLLCHSPHESVQLFLLKRQGRAVCLDCHKMPKLLKVKEHTTMGEAACESCHDPHCSNLKKLLRPPPPPP